MGTSNEQLFLFLNVGNDVLIQLKSLKTKQKRRARPTAIGFQSHKTPFFNRQSSRWQICGELKASEMTEERVAFCNETGADALLDDITD